MARKVKAPPKQASPEERISAISTEIDDAIAAADDKNASDENRTAAVQRMIERQNERRYLQRAQRILKARPVKSA